MKMCAFLNLLAMLSHKLSCSNIEHEFIVPFRAAEAGRFKFPSGNINPHQIDGIPNRIR